LYPSPVDAVKYEIDLFPTPPYDFSKSFGFLKVRRDPMDRFDGVVFSRIWSLPKYRWAFMSLQSLGTLDRPRLLLCLEGEHLSEPEAKNLKQQIETTYCLHLDLNAFCEVIRSEQPIFDLTQTHPGMKPGLEPNLFEALVWAITGQQINMSFACQVKEGMLARYGGKINITGTEYYRHPEPEELANLNPADWVSFKSSRRKAEYIIGLAKLIREGLNLAALNDLPDDEIVAQLLQIRGIGRWTAEYVLLRGLGRWDVLPATDAGLINGIRQAYHLDHRPSTEEITRLGERWRPWRGLATYYLWWAK
jgi:DNA-3-methyladenine glycosylase II